MRFGAPNMKTYIYVLALVLAILATTLMAKSVVAPTKLQAAEVEATDPLNHQQRAWLGALEWCESGGNPDAINPNDADNTPSYGILQFKPSTFIYFQKKYQLEGELMDPDAQEAIVEQMIIRGGVNWGQQFPACTRKLGSAPKLSPLSVDKK